jgi:DNA-directed RNA polymerase subunit F
MSLLSKILPFSNLWLRTSWFPFQIHPDVGAYESQAVFNSETGLYSQVFSPVGGGQSLSWHGVVQNIAQMERLPLSAVVSDQGLLNAYIANSDWGKQKRDIEGFSPPSVDSPFSSHNFLTPAPMTQQSPPPQAPEAPEQESPTLSKEEWADLDLRHFNDHPPEFHEQEPQDQPSLSKEEWADLDLRQVEERSNDPPEPQISTATEPLWSQEPPPQECPATQKPSLVSEEEQLEARIFHDQVELEQRMAEKRSLDFVNKLANVDPHKHQGLCAEELAALEEFLGRDYAVQETQVYRKDIFQVLDCGWMYPGVLDSPSPLNWFRLEGEDEMTKLGDSVSQEEFRILRDEVELQQVAAEKRSLDFVNKLAKADPQEQARLCAEELANLEESVGRESAVQEMQVYRKDLLQVAACGWLDPAALDHFRFEDQTTKLGDTVNQEDLMGLIDFSLFVGEIPENDYVELNTKLSELLDEQFQEPSAIEPELSEQGMYEQQHRPLGEAMLGQFAQEQLREECLNNLLLEEPEHKIGGFDL